MSLVARVLSNIGLQRRILLSVAVGLGVSLGGFAFLSLYFMDQSTDRVLAEQLAVAQMNSAHVDQVLEDVVSQLQIAAARTSTVGDDGDRSSQRRILAEAHGLMRRFVSRLVLIGQGGQVLLVVPPDSDEMGLDYSSRSYVHRTFATRVPTIATAFSSAHGERPGIAVTVPVHDEEGQPVGLLSGEIDFAQPGLGDFLRPVSVGRTGFMQLVDENGLILATTERADAGPAEAGTGGTFTSHPEHFPSLVREARPVVRVCHTCHQTANGLQRGRDIMAFAPLATAPMGVALRFKEEDVFGTAYGLRQYMLIYSVGVFLLGLLFAWLSTNAVVRPLEALTAAARRIGGGDLGSPVHLEGSAGGGETAALAATLEGMRRRLRASYERIELYNRDLEERVAQRTRELSILFEVSQTLTRTVDVDTLMHTVVEKIVSTVEAADAALLYRYDPVAGVLAPVAAVGYDLALLDNTCLRPGESTAGMVLEAGEPLLFAGPEAIGMALARLSAENAGRTELARRGSGPPEAALGAPIVYEGSVVGVLLLESQRRPDAFDASDRALLQAIADQVAVAIDHARLVYEASQLEALREADRLKSEFLLSVSHELRTPLASIVSLVEVMAADHRSIRRRQLGQLLGILDRSAHRLKDMVENLLDAGSIQAGRFRVQQQPAELGGIVQDALACVLPSLENKEQAVDVDIPAHGVAVLADRERIVQVLVNLISNANKYCPPRQRFQLSAERLGDWVRVRVADAGPGIPEEDQQHIFDRFYRSSRHLAVAGAGLGLAIVKAIVEAHGGQIALESQVGKGTTITFTLPLVASMEDVAVSSARPREGRVP